MSLVLLVRSPTATNTRHLHQTTISNTEDRVVHGSSEKELAKTVRTTINHSSPKVVGQELSTVVSEGRHAHGDPKVPYIPIPESQYLS